MDTEFKVIRMGFDHLEKFLNNCYLEFPHYDIYEILPEHSYDGAFAVVILKLNTYWKGGAE
jgi:hypothetical protein